MTEPEWGARVGADGSFAYRDYDDQDHSWSDAHDLARDWWSDSSTRGARGGEWRTQARPLVDDVLQAGHPASVEVLQALADEAASDEELVVHGAGPLEDLLSHHGHAEAFVDEIERRAVSATTFPHCGERTLVGPGRAGVRTESAVPTRGNRAGSHRAAQEGTQEATGWEGTARWTRLTSTAAWSRQRHVSVFANVRPFCIELHNVHAERLSQHPRSRPRALPSRRYRVRPDTRPTAQINR